MIAQLTHIGPQVSTYRLKGDANETLLLIGSILFWAAVLPIASVVFAIVAVWDRLGSSRRRQLVPWGGVLSQFPGRRIQKADQGDNFRIQLHRR